MPSDPNSVGSVFLMCVAHDASVLLCCHMLNPDDSVSSGLTFKGDEMKRCVGLKATDVM